MAMAYLDCFSGISGDMTLGALVNLGVPVNWLQQEVAKLPIDGFKIDEKSVTFQGISATKIEVLIEENHHHRNHACIRALIEDSPFSEPVKARSLVIFDHLAGAEAAVHGLSKDEVHFHEVGGLDAIVDIVGTCLAAEYLHIDEVICSALPLGSGFVKCLHGTLPVPAPATLEILKGVPVYSGPVQEELVTPTGAAIAVSLAGSFRAMPRMKVNRIGYGAGSRELASQPNLLRILIGEKTDLEPGLAGERLTMVACCIDDMNPEYFSYLMEVLFDDGALDVYWVPVHMKKNRPGTMVEVLCAEEKRDRVVERILAETTTLGVRYHPVHRTALKREAVQVATRWGTVTAKQITGLDGVRRIVPEFEVCKQIAQAHGVPLRIVYEAVVNAGRNHIQGMRKKDL